MEGGLPVERGVGDFTRHTGDAHSINTRPGSWWMNCRLEAGAGRQGRGEAILVHLKAFSTVMILIIQTKDTYCLLRDILTT